MTETPANTWRRWITLLLGVGTFGLGVYLTQPVLTLPFSHPHRHLPGRGLAYFTQPVPHDVKIAALAGFAATVIGALLVYLSRCKLPPLTARAAWKLLLAKLARGIRGFLFLVMAGAAVFPAMAAMRFVADRFHWTHDDLDHVVPALIGVFGLGLILFGSWGVWTALKIIFAPKTAETDPDGALSGFGWAILATFILTPICGVALALYAAAMIAPAGSGSEHMVLWALRALPVIAPWVLPLLVAVFAIPTPLFQVRARLRAGTFWREPDALFGLALGLTVTAAVLWYTILMIISPTAPQVATGHVWELTERYHKVYITDAQRLSLWALGGAALVFFIPTIIADRLRMRRRKQAAAALQAT
jgi:hypothetical protein